MVCVFPQRFFRSLSFSKFLAWELTPIVDTRGGKRLLNRLLGQPKELLGSPPSWEFGPRTPPGFGLRGRISGPPRGILPCGGMGELKTSVVATGCPTPVLALAPAQRGGLVARCGSLRRPAHHLFAGAVPGAGHPWGEPLRGGLSALGRRLLRRTAALPDTYESTKVRKRKYESTKRSKL